MELGLQLTVGIRQLTGIELEAFHQPKQLEMIHADLLEPDATAVLLALGKRDGVVELAVAGRFNTCAIRCSKHLRH
ncbi:hypothetical protein KBAD14_KBAD14_16270 [Aeromonas dhakensis]|nr:hypothetical protein KBAD59_16290 [Aeromonas dhakensis]CAD7514355.1 hypothetical protein KBAD14_KBAD14_16270 [Aeromonas dhakensis]CAD7514417.1 hypothetical protein KBAD10_16280 [Aeromonas dhakensis]CAD7519104.1 hypothetical protein KBAD05_16260 [Aeromonas dhakensis]